MALKHHACTLFELEKKVEPASTALSVHSSHKSLATCTIIIYPTWSSLHVQVFTVTSSIKSVAMLWPTELPSHSATQWLSYSTYGWAARDSAEGDTKLACSMGRVGKGIRGGSLSFRCLFGLWHIFSVLIFLICHSTYSVNHSTFSRGNLMSAG